MPVLFPSSMSSSRMSVQRYFIPVRVRATSMRGISSRLSTRATSATSSGAGSGGQCSSHVVVRRGGARPGRRRFSGGGSRLVCSSSSSSSSSTDNKDSTEESSSASAESDSSSENEADAWRGVNVDDIQDMEPRSPPYGLVAGVGAVGAVETLYLTAVKVGLLGSLACPTNGCESVVASDWGALFGVPLPLFGFACYSAVAALGYAGLQAKANEDESESSSSSSSSSSDESIKNILLPLSVTMAGASTYLMYALFAKLGGDCPYCLASAALSFTLAASTVSGFQARELMSGAKATISTLAFILPIAILGVANLDSEPIVKDISLPYRPVPVETESSELAVEVAQKLSAAHARFYGAFWCSHCADQKQFFGKDAFTKIDYVECFPNGYESKLKGPMAPACNGNVDNGYPQWVIEDGPGGKPLRLSPGEKSVSELEGILKRNNLW